MLRFSLNVPAIIAYKLVALFLLLGSSRIGHAAGTWSTLSRPLQPGQVRDPAGLAVGDCGDLDVADRGNGRILERDTQGRWTVLATYGRDPGQVLGPDALAAHRSG